MADLANNMSCCGLDEIYGIQNRDSDQPSHHLKEVYQQWYGSSGGDNDGPPILVFTAVVKGDSWYRNKKAGDQLTAYIKKHKLGTVVASKAKKNPNSGNIVKGYMWAVSASAFHRWAKKQMWYTEWYQDMNWSSFPW